MKWKLAVRANWIRESSSAFILAAYGIEGAGISPWSAASIRRL